VPAGESVQKVVVRAGGLVDGVTLTTSTGRSADLGGEMAWSPGAKG
jgi:hypothetical protein